MGNYSTPPQILVFTTLCRWQ